MSPHRRYRATGATLPFGDLLGAHDDRSVRVDLGPQARLELDVDRPVGWPRPRTGGQVVRLGNPVVTPVSARVEETWVLRGHGGGWEVEVDGAAPLGAAHVPPIPLPAQRRNIPGALEHTAGSMYVRVRRWGRLVREGRSTVAGLEHGGLVRATAEMEQRGAPVGATGARPVVETP